MTEGVTVATITPSDPLRGPGGVLQAGTEQLRPAFSIARLPDVLYQVDRKSRRRDHQSGSCPFPDFNPRNAYLYHSLHKLSTL